MTFPSCEIAGCDTQAEVVDDGFNLCRWHATHCDCGAVLDDMLEGRHVRLALSAGIESVRLCPAVPARALLGRLAGARFAVIPAPGTTVPADVLSANGHLLGAVAEVEAALGEGLADGHLSESETIRIVAALAQAQGRITALLGSLGVRA